MSEPRDDWHRSRAKRLQAAAIPLVVSPVIRLLGRTLDWQAIGSEHLLAVTTGGRQPILALWHGRIFSATYFFQRRGIVAMASQNFDGEWITRVLERFGYRAARGSTSRGGPRALVQMAREMAKGSPAAFTVDGPRGPAYRAQPGAVWLAKITGNPIVPFHIEASRHWTGRSWDRHQVPKPFSRVVVAIGAPIEVPPDADDERIECTRAEVERALNRLRDEAIEALRQPR